VDAKSQKIALLRYGLIAPLILELRLPPGELTRRAREIACRIYNFPYSRKTSISVDSLLDWVLRYHKGGFEALVPKLRDDRGQSRAITPQIAELIERLKRANPGRSVTSLLRELPLSPEEDRPAVSAPTVYRFLKLNVLSTRDLLAGRPLEPYKNSWRIEFIRIEDRRLLTEWRRSKNKNLWQKAVTVLENQNLLPEEIAKKVERPVAEIRKWIKAFNRDGLDGLNPPRKPYANAQKREAALDQKRRRILEILHDSPRSFGINRSNWSLPSLAAAYSRQHDEPISRSTVGRLVKKSGYTMKKARKVLSSPDPEYREKVDLVLHTLQTLKPGELFFFVDELGPLRVKRYGGRTFVRKAEPYTIPQNQTYLGVVTMAGALNAVTNQVTWVYGRSKDTSAMIDLIEILFNQHRSASKLYITWDMASWHRSNLLVEWLDTFNEETERSAEGPLIHLVPLPTSSQFLDVIEAIFSGKKKAVIHHSNYRSEEEMKAAISRHFAERNEYFIVNPKRQGKRFGT
jgi:transposase